MDDRHQLPHPRTSLFFSASPSFVLFLPFDKALPTHKRRVIREGLLSSRSSQHVTVTSRKENPAALACEDVHLPSPLLGRRGICLLLLWEGCIG